MKLNNLNPKHLFRSNKTRSRSVSRSRSVTRSDPTSYSSGSSSSSDGSGSSTNLKNNASSTPKSVLRSAKSQEISSDWSDFSTDLHYELVQAFKLIDKDGDGKITKLELETLLSRIIGADPPSEQVLMMMLTDIDCDSNGCISLKEFESISSAFEPACKSELRAAFDFFDSDRDGKISAQELLGVFKSIIGDDHCTLDECQRMIAGVDSDGDGYVCFEDFSRMMMEQQR